jgi:hypothetical protein
MEQPTKSPDPNTNETAINEPGINSEPEPATDIPSSPSEEVDDGGKYKLSFEIDVSRRYNLHMARKLRDFGRLTKLFTIMGGSAAFVSFLNQTETITPWLGLAGTLSLTFATALDIVYGFEPASFQHRQLAKEYTTLLRQLNAGASVETVTDNYYAIEANEDAPQKRILNSAHNETLKNRGFVDKEKEEFSADKSWWVFW